MGLRRWRWKFSTGCIGVGNQLFHRNHQPHSKCPLCQSPNEKVSHVLHCPDRAATTFTTARIQHHLSDALVALDTEPILSSAILDIILSWRRGEFAVGSATLAAASCYLIDSRSLEDLHQDSLDGKRQWLHSVCAARTAFAAQLGTPPSAPTAQATMFRAWLGLSATPPSAS